MQITCPHCGFSKQINRKQLPPDATRANCPRCKQAFPLQQSMQQYSQTAAETVETEQTTTQKIISSRNPEIDVLPKAGFWIRLVAMMIDAFIVFMLQFLLGSLIAVAGFVTGAGSESIVGNMVILVQLFSYTLSFAYYIFFTGYCGQTPGKMALRIKVIRCDGSQISYGRAAFREIPAKFISGILFGIGYLMVAFDEQKQGLHDRMVDTYVIKL